MLTIRRAESADAAALQAIYASCIANATWLPASARKELDFAAVSQGESILLAQANQGDILGFISVQTEPAYIHHFYIAAHARGAGIGRDLLRALQPWLATPWQLKCVRANQDALGFYHSLGWQEVGSGSSEHGAYALLQWPPLPT